jgi:hypothetical protein
VPPITFQGNCRAKPKAAPRKFQQFGDADRISGDINDLMMPIAEKAADMICCRAPSLVIDLPEHERTRADVRLETPYAQPSNFRCRG